jgi:hypothetical protein
MENVDIYYESLREIYDEMGEWRPPREPEGNTLLKWTIGLLVFFLLSSIIPVTPLALIYLAGRFHWTIRGYGLTFSIGNFALVWVTLVLISTLLLMPTVWLQNRIKNREKKKQKQKPAQSLSAEQITFICAYEAYKELKIFFISHIDQHVEQSLHALMRILPDDGDTFYNTLGDEMVGYEITSTSFVEPHPADPSMQRYIRSYPFQRSSSLPRQIFIARSFLRTFDQLGWFRLEARTKSILEALTSLRLKVVSRLRQRENLPEVLSILKNLSHFAYAYLPEHKTYMQSAELTGLQTEGAVCLDRFIEELNSLALISRVEEEKPKIEEGRSWKEKYSNYHANSVFFRFTEWFVLILILTSVAFLAINFFVKLSPDTIATVIIGTSVASAAALAGLLPAKTSSKSAKKTGKRKKNNDDG